MATSAEKEIHLGEVLEQDDVRLIPCAILFSDGEEVKLWVGSFGESKIYEKMGSQGHIYIIKSVVGASEVDYWANKFHLIKLQWQRDEDWRKWTRSKLSALRNLIR